MSSAKQRSCLTWVGIIAVVAVVSTLLFPNFVQARARGQLTACKSNLKNIGTAAEMYSTDWEGRYPNSLALLTPNYLQTIPECPPARRVTYEYERRLIALNKFVCLTHDLTDANKQCDEKLRALNRSVQLEEFAPSLEASSLPVCPDGEVYRYDAYLETYWMCCKGSNHEGVSVPADYPQYDGIQGLIDR